MSVQNILCVLLSVALTFCHGFEWLQVPDTVNACVGGQAHFRWMYNASYDIQMVYWRFQGTGKTVLGHHFEPRDEIFYYEYPSSRVMLTDRKEANAGIILKGVQLSDAGKYTVELSVLGLPGVTGEADLRVFTKPELNPTLQIDNHDVQFGATSNVTLCKSCIVVITTSHALPADITITSGQTRITCPQKTTCSMSLNWDGREAKSIEMNFEIDYGFCEKMERSVQVYWSSPGSGTTGVLPGGDDGETPGDNGSGYDGPGQKTSIIIGIVIGVLLMVILMLVVMVCVFYKRLKRRHAKEKPLTKREDAFLNVVRKWRSVARKTKTQNEEKNVEPSERVVSFTRSLSVPASSGRASLQEARAAEFRVDIEPKPRDPLLEVVDEDSLDGKDPNARPDPDGEVDPTVVDDPDVTERGDISTPSTDEAIEARESELGSPSPAVSRIDSIDSSYVFVSRNPDGGESSNNSNSNLF